MTFQSFCRQCLFFLPPAFDFSTSVYETGGALNDILHDVLSRFFKVISLIYNSDLPFYDLYNRRLSNSFQV